MALFLLLPFVVMFLPYDWLARAANKTIFFALSDRHEADYAYLLAHRPEFADAYVGGVVVQLAVLVAGVVVHSYFAITSRDIVFVEDRKGAYFCWASIAIVVFAFSAFSFSRLTDFGLSTDVSWFADNPEARRRLTPVATNSSAFLMTGLFLAAEAAFVPAGVVQTLIIFALGRRVSFNDIKGDYVNAKQ
ncbi:hypothetical protein [Sinorhizobium arboris]|uniref:hypothetical protein n=1 Tax=Sinorhizobium arboris TaxID=76745 RepID=UPI00124348D2|nr:hypothetical protein [Sinorhizobium arboris]